MKQLFQQGQIGLIVILIMAVGLTIGLAVASQSLTDISITETEEQSLRAFNAAEAGIETGDILEGFASAAEAVGFIDAHRGEEISFTLVRGNERKTITARLREDASQGGLGVYLADGEWFHGAQALLREAGSPPLGFFPALGEGFSQAIAVARLTVQGLGQAVLELVTRGSLVEGIVGPVGIFSFAGQAVRVGSAHLINLIGMISINLAVVNLIPFPALDGGRFLLILFEKVKGSPISRRAETFVNTVGFALLLLFMVAVTVRDVMNL